MAATGYPADEAPWAKPLSPSSSGANSGVRSPRTCNSPRGGAPMELSTSQTMRLTATGSSCRPSDWQQKANLENSLTDEVLVQVWWESSHDGSAGDPTGIAISPGWSVREVAKLIAKQKGLPKDNEIQLSVHRTVALKLHRPASGPDAAAGSGRVVLDPGQDFTVAILEAIRSSGGLSLAVKRRMSTHPNDEARHQRVTAQNVQKHKSIMAKVDKSGTVGPTKSVAWSPSTQEADSDCSSNSEIWDVNSQRRCTRKQNDVFRFGGKDLHGKPLPNSPGSGRGRVLSRSEEDHDTFGSICACVERDGGDDREVKTNQEMDDEEAECDMCFARPSARKPQFTDKAKQTKQRL